MKRRLVALALLTSAVAARAFDASLIDRLLSEEPSVSSAAFLEAGAMADPDKQNLAAALSGRLEEAGVGERAALALCRLGDPAVPYLHRHARTSFPGAEYAYMGLLMNGDAGNAAAAAILRNGDDAAVLRSLAVIEAAKTMPLAVSEEVRRLSEDTDQRYRDAAKAAMKAVAEARAAEASPAGAAAAQPAGTLPGFTDLASFEAYLRTLQDNLGEAPVSVEPTPSPAAGKFAPRQPDTSGYRTRQPAADLFRKNASQ